MAVFLMLNYRCGSFFINIFSILIIKLKLNWASLPVANSLVRKMPARSVNSNYCKEIDYIKLGVIQILVLLMNWISFVKGSNGLNVITYLFLIHGITLSFTVGRNVSRQFLFSMIQSHVKPFRCLSSFDPHFRFLWCFFQVSISCRSKVMLRSFI